MVEIHETCHVDDKIAKGKMAFPLFFINCPETRSTTIVMSKVEVSMLFQDEANLRAKREAKENGDIGENNDGSKETNRKASTFLVFFQR